jgi:hypothetical protein
MNKHNMPPRKKKLIAAAGLLMVGYHYISKRKMRRKWVKNWLARRDLFGHMPLLKELNENEPNDLKNYLRMSKPDFDRLLGKCLTN